MTVCIYDGVNFLVDKIVQCENDTGRRHAENEIVSYFESCSKFVFPKKEERYFKATYYDRKVQLYTVVGSSAPERGFIHYLSGVVDVVGLINTCRSFPSADIIGKESVNLFVDEDGTLRQLKHRYNEFNGKAKVTEHSWTREKLNEVGCIVFGLPEQMLYDFEYKFMQRQLTAIEMLVLAQSKYAELGTTFDHWNSETGTLVENINLSKRQRDFILAGIKADITFEQVDPVHIVHSVNKK